LHIFIESSVFVVPTLRLYEEPICSFVLTDFFVEFEKQKGPTPFDPRLIAIEKVKEDLKNDLLASLKANMCQHIETLMYKEVDRLHIEYEAKQKVLNEERLKTKRPETKQIFDFEEQFSNASGMGTKSVFGSNRMVKTRKFSKLIIFLVATQPKYSIYKENSQKERRWTR
jgi:hypothetical protein